MSLSKKEKLRAVHGDLLVEIKDTSDEEINEAALLLEIEKGFQGQPPLSQNPLQNNDFLKLPQR